MSPGSQIPRGERAVSFSGNSTPAVDVTRRRFTAPSPYTSGHAAAERPVAPPTDPASQANNQAYDPVMAPASTVHEYNVTSRGKNYALISVMSRAPNCQHSPLLYRGESLRGSVELSRKHLNGMQRMDIGVSLFPIVKVMIEG
jgi:hypothetical protein